MDDLLEDVLREIALARSAGYDSLAITIEEGEALSGAIASLRLSLSEKSAECDRWIARVRLLEARAASARSALSARAPEAPPPTAVDYAVELGCLAGEKALPRFENGDGLPTIRSVSVACDDEWEHAALLIVGRYPFSGSAPKLKRAFGRAFYSAINGGEGRKR